MFTGMPWCIARMNLEFTVDSAISPEGNLFIYFLQNKHTFTKFSFGNYWAK